ncbi:RloB family protein [Xanthomonas sontii]|uniref:RloB family protein n=1 Tax=Xanthomonas sontii TaxID=2650745 RepID=UPI0011E43765|nr:RloB family protein [Xanthomonas sontii]MDQ7759404.1 RloB family protein [Xanthomonas sontii]TYD34870.1 hypothetical protein CEK63_10710 [Xanthomonas sontii]UZK07094.1 RloB domain-containing protein [Xanthomonas sontii]
MSRIPSPPSLKRRSPHLESKVEVVIACEGTVTEPDYFQKCIGYYGAGLVRLRILPRTGVPMTVVKAAVAEKEKLQLKARKAPLADRIPFSVWAVFDRDEHDVEPAFALARTNKIGLAFSNPCFELWPLLHLNQEYGAQEGRHEVQRHLNLVMPGYHHTNNARVDFEMMKSHVGAAISRAAHLNISRENEGCPNGCPSTTVGNLVQKIIDNGRINFRIKA